jgi:heme/copper-type cytochrome/quinol oxidase subunit 2
MSVLTIIPRDTDSFISPRDRRDAVLAAQANNMMANLTTVLTLMFGVCVCAFYFYFYYRKRTWRAVVNESRQPYRQ